MPKRKRSKSDPHPTRDKKAWESLDSKMQSRIDKVLTELLSNNQDKEQTPALFCETFEDKLNLRHVKDSDIAHCLEQKTPKESLQNLLASLHFQQSRAELAFSKMDPAGKQCLVIEDIMRTAQELDIEMTHELAEEMIALCGSGEVVDFDSFVKIARMVNL